MKFKQQDYIMLAAGLVLGVILAFVANKYIFSSASNNTQVDVVPVIHTDFKAPSSQYFNSQAIDPTQIINISPNNTTQPFNGSQ